MLLDQTHVNRLANIAFLHDDADSAKKVLRLLLADDLKQEKKKMEDEAKLTPTEIATREKKTAEKSAATRLKNLE